MKMREMLTSGKGAPTLWATALLLVSILFPPYVFSQSDFFEGKTLRIIQGRRPGGTGDMRTRAVVHFLSKYIPGNPNILFEYMPGGGGRKAANYLFNAATPDGLTIANIGAGFLTNAVLGAPGVQYDYQKMIYLGSGNSKATYVFVTRKETGLDSMEELLQARGLRIGTLSVGHDIYINARLFAWLLDLQDPKFIPGYSGPELDQAVLSGEVDARVNILETIVHRSPDWIDKQLVDFQSVFEIPSGYRADHPAFSKLPALQKYAESEIDRKVLEMARTFRLVGSPYLLGPGVPEERVKVLREAFRKLFTDPELKNVWQKFTGEPPSPLLPQEQAQAIKNVPRDSETVETFKRLAGAGPLPSH